MKTDNIILLAALGIGGYYLISKVSQNQGTSGGGGSTGLNLDLSGFGGGLGDLGGLLGSIGGLGSGSLGNLDFSSLFGAAQNSAQGLINQAQAEANKVMGGAGTSAATLIDQAKAEADKLLGGVNLSAGGILDQAKAAVDKLLKNIPGIPTLDLGLGGGSKGTSGITTAFDEAGGAIGWINRKLGTTTLGDTLWEWGASDLGWLTPGLKLESWLVTPKDSNKLSDYAKSVIANQNENTITTQTERSTNTALAPEKVIAQYEATPSPGQESPAGIAGAVESFFSKQTNFPQNLFTPTPTPAPTPTQPKVIDPGRGIYVDPKAGIYHL